MNVDVQKESSVLDCGLWRKRGRDISNEEYIKERGAIRLYSCCGQVTTGGRPTAAYAPGKKNGERPAGGYCIGILDIGYWTGFDAGRNMEDADAMRSDETQ